MRYAHPAAALLIAALAALVDPHELAAQNGGAPRAADRAAATGSPAAAPAPVGERPVLTLSAAIRLALQNSPRLLAAGGNRLLRVGEASDLSAFPNPHVEWRREGLGVAGATDDFFTVALPVDVTGRRLVARGAVKATDRSAVADSQAVANAVAFDAARAYHRAALAVALTRVASRQQEALESIASHDSTRWRLGAVSEGTALRAGLESDRGRATATMASIEEERLRAALVEVLGADEDSVGSPLPLTTDGVNAAALQPLPPMDALMERAALQRPELRAATAAVDAAERRVTAQRLGILGDVTVGGGTRRSGGETGGTIAVGLSLPLLDRNGPARQRAEAELMKARAALRQTELAVRSEVAASAAAYERLRLGVAPIAASAGSRGADVAGIVQAAYLEGGATLLELLDAQRVAADMDAAALRWLTDLQLARLDLLQAVGDPLPEAP